MDGQGQNGSASYFSYEVHMARHATRMLLLMAGALLGSIPVAIIYSFFVEHYVAGLTSGSVKA